MNEPSPPSSQTKPAPQVSFVIVNWNRRALLEQCLASLVRQTLQDFELILVDNGSNDGSVESLSQFALPACSVIRNHGNLGFGRAVNQGIAAARGRFIALVNNDVVLEPRWLEEILRGFTLDPRAGMCAGKTLLSYDRGRIDKAAHLIYGDGQAYGRGHQEEDRGQYNQVEEALWPDGAAAVYRAELFAEAGNFDDDFFAYGDDAELGLRARLCGWKCFYIPTAVGYHHHSSTLGPFSPQKIFLVERNRIWMVAKLFPLRQILLVPFYSANRYLLSLWALITGRGSVSRSARQGSVAAMLGAVLRAQFAALAGIPRMLAKRRQFNKHRKISTAELLSILKRHSISARRISLHS